MCLRMYSLCSVLELIYKIIFHRKECGSKNVKLFKQRTIIGHSLGLLGLIPDEDYEFSQDLSVDIEVAPVCKTKYLKLKFLI